MPRRYKTARGCDKGTLARTLIGPCGQVTSLPDRRQAYGSSPLVKSLHPPMLPPGHPSTQATVRRTGLSWRQARPVPVGFPRSAPTKVGFSKSKGAHFMSVGAAGKMGPVPGVWPRPEPFAPRADPAVLEDLRARLRATRWPDAPE